MVEKRKQRRIVEFTYREHAGGENVFGRFIRAADWSDNDLIETVFDRLENGDMTGSEYHHAVKTLYCITYREGFRTRPKVLISSLKD